MRRASPVAQLTLVTMPSLPPRWRDSALQLVCAEPCSLRLRPKSSTSRVVISRLPHVRFRYRLVTRNHPLMALSVGFRVSVSLHPATQATGPRLLPRWDFLPLSVPAFPGRTGLLSVHSRYNLQTRRVALRDPLHRRLRRLCYLHRRSNCYRVERSSSRAGLSPAVVQYLSRRTVMGMLRQLRNDPE
jgi:hypothetical protein